MGQFIGIGILVAAGFIVAQGNLLGFVGAIVATFGGLILGYGTRKETE